MKPVSLDPENWAASRQLAHRMLDDMLDHLQEIGDKPVWKPIDAEAIANYRTRLPVEGSSINEVYDDFRTNIAEYSLHSTHPGFMGWVQGGGNVVGLMAEILSAGLNANVGGRNQSPIEIEREVVGWMRELFQFPKSASGIFLTGSSMANFLAILVARQRAMASDVRKEGLRTSAKQLAAYTSQAAHRCISQALDMAGIGSKWLRKIPVDDQHHIRLDLLREAILEDQENGITPFCLVGCGGTVDVGAIDDMKALRRIADEHNLWFHVDGAFGALGMASDQIAPRLDGIQDADSIAFDFHKWGQVQYDAGFLLVRDGLQHQATFENPADYLSRDGRALSAGSPWPCDLGPDLSRSFRALKTWMTLKTYGMKRIGEIVDNTCSIAKHLETRIHSLPELELLAPVELNIVCFRVRCDDADRVNQEIVTQVQLRGRVVPSSTRIHGKFAIRAALFNHRTTTGEVDLLLEEVLAVYRSLRMGRSLVETKNYAA